MLLTLESISVGNRLVYCNVRLSYNLACTAIGTASKSIKMQTLDENIYLLEYYTKILKYWYD